MKKVTMILLATGFCIAFITAGAQVTPGIKGGFNFARLSGFDGNARVSGHAGLFLHHTINSHWCFQPELLYSGEGQRYFSDGEERTIALNYLQVPLMIQYYPISQLYFEAGPQFGILANAQDRGTGSEKINVKNDFTTTQIGLGLGMGVKASNSLSFYGRYNFGLTDVSRFDNIVDQSQVGQVGLAIRLK